jgi:hypothetical protein
MNKYIKNIIITIVVPTVVAALDTILVHYEIGAQNIFTAEYRAFENFNEALENFLIVFAVVAFLTILSLLSFSYLKGRQYFICPSCEEPQTVNNFKKVSLCKRCGTKLVPLKGFYDNKKVKKEQKTIKKTGSK